VRGCIEMVVRLETVTTGDDIKIVTVICTTYFTIYPIITLNLLYCVNLWRGIVGPVDWLTFGLSERCLIPVRSWEFSVYATPRPELAPIQQPFSAEVNLSKHEISN
jgi:hypothetical protein